ncbi:hypothetical protein PPGU19_092160 (plasmid) [Paraburkholderia sp. PGU19]|nr:hypothetical protein PPGU19_092160 [Paraburkholderia sp. PGU19]
MTKHPCDEPEHAQRDEQCARHDWQHEDDNPHGPDGSRLKAHGRPKRKSGMCHRGSHLKIARVRIPRSLR